MHQWKYIRINCDINYKYLVTTNFEDTNEVGSNEQSTLWYKLHDKNNFQPSFYQSYENQYALDSYLN